MTGFPGQGTPVTGVRGHDGDKYAQWDAAYVLGSLSEMDRREFDAHLPECRECRDAVDELSGMPALLSLLDLDANDCRYPYGGDRDDESRSPFAVIRGVRVPAIARPIFI